MSTSKGKILQKFMVHCEYDEHQMKARTGIDYKDLENITFWEKPITESIAKKLTKIFPFDEKYWMQ